MAALYVETNLLVAMATGRDAAGRSLIEGSIAGLRLLVPGACFLEAFGWMEGETRRRKGFGRSLQDQVDQLRRDSTAEARPLEFHLAEAIIANERILRIIADRLRESAAMLSSHAEILPVDRLLLARGRSGPLIAELTDDLILRIILDHARSSPEPDKALLTENRNDFGRPDVRAALAEAGLIYFSSSERAIAWAESRPGGD